MVAVPASVALCTGAIYYPIMDQPARGTLSRLSERLMRRLPGVDVRIVSRPTSRAQRPPA